MHTVVETNQAPKAVGPYSQAVIATGQKMVFVSGQIPLDSISIQIVGVDAHEQTKVVLKNLLAVLAASGASCASVVKTTVYLKNMEDFAVVNEEYARVFHDHKPARACVEVARLPKDVLVEIDAIAVI